MIIYDNYFIEGLYEMHCEYGHQYVYSDKCTYMFFLMQFPEKRKLK